MEDSSKNVKNNNETYDMNLFKPKNIKKSANYEQFLWHRPGEIFFISKVLRKVINVEQKAFKKMREKIYSAHCFLVYTCWSG